MNTPSTNSTLQSNASHAAALLVAAMLLLTAGCEANHYELEMTVEGETLHRRLVCWRQSGSDDQQNLKPMPEGELQRLAAAYGAETPENGERKFEFAGEFVGRTPDDVGGAGNLTMEETDLGRTWMYMERFRGEDDLSATLAAREQACDDFIAAIAAWLSAEYSNHDGFDAVHGFVVGQLRDDLHNLSAYASLGSAIEETGLLESTAIQFEVTARLGQYALEREYLNAAELSRLVRSVNNQDGEALKGTLRTVLESKLGPHLSNTDWRMLEDSERLNASINEGLQDYPPYVERLEEWRDEHPDGNAGDAPTPANFVGETAAVALGLSFTATDDLRVTLHCPARPFRTNGVWTPDDGTVVWDRGLTPSTASSSPRPRTLPSLLFAFWSEPDEAFQVEHFGRVLLRDELLADYVAWRNSLPAEVATEWDAFVTGLLPSPSLRYRVETFRFAPAGGTPSAELLERGRELILSGFESGS